MDFFKGFCVSISFSSALILVISCLLLAYFILFYFRFWDTCAGHAGLLHRYIHNQVVCSLYSPFDYIQHFSPCYPSPPAAVSPLAPPRTAPSVWCSFPWVHTFSLFNSCLWVRTCGLLLAFDFVWSCSSSCFNCDVRVLILDLSSLLMWAFSAINFPLYTALNVSQRFWYVVSLFSLVSKNIFISAFISLFIQ